MFDKLFDDVGRKIKAVAEILFIVLLLCSLVVGTVMLAVSMDFWWVGLLTILLGPACAWASMLLIYGVGELIEKTQASEEHLRALNRKADEVSADREELATEENSLPKI